MNDRGCDDWRLLVQADADGELGVAETAALERHVVGCAKCEKLRDDLVSLSRRFRAEIARESAPEGLRHALMDQLGVSTEPAPPNAAGKVIPFRRSWHPRSWRAAASFVAGAAIAASLALVVMPRQQSEIGGVAGELIAGHIRALQPGHLMDVVSTDKHTVKPWFDGRIDFAPPVKDLVGDGFPLIGGRLDYVGGRPVAALAYRRGQHIIDLFVWPEGPEPGRTGEGSLARNGYNLQKWQAGGMEFWAVSDLNSDELAQFGRLWRAAT